MAEVVLRASIGQGTADSDRVVGSICFVPSGAAAARRGRSLMALLLLLLEMDRRVRDGAHCRDLDGLLHLYGGEQSMVSSTSFFPGGAAAARWERSLMALLLLEMDRRVRDGAHWDLDGLLRQYYLARDEQSLVGDDQAEDLRFGFDEDGHRDICGVDTSISAAPPGADAALDVDLLSDLLGLDNPSLCASTPGGDGGLDADPGSSASTDSADGKFGGLQMLMDLLSGILLVGSRRSVIFVLDEVHQRWIAVPNLQAISLFSGTMQTVPWALQEESLVNKIVLPMFVAKPLAVTGYLVKKQDRWFLRSRESRGTVQIDTNRRIWVGTCTDVNQTNLVFPCRFGSSLWINLFPDTRVIHL